MERLDEHILRKNGELLFFFNQSLVAFGLKKFFNSTPPRPLPPAFFTIFLSFLNVFTPNGTSFVLFSCQKLKNCHYLSFVVGCSFKIKTKMFSRELGRNQFSESVKETAVALAELFFMRENCISSLGFKSSC